MSDDGTAEDDRFRVLIDPLPGGGWSIKLVRYWSNEDRIGWDSYKLNEELQIVTRSVRPTERGARRTAKRILRRARRANARSNRERIIVGGAE